MSSVISLIEVKVKQICVAWLWHPIRGNKTNTIYSVGTTSMAAAYKSTCRDDLKIINTTNTFES